MCCEALGTHGGLATSDLSRNVMQGSTSRLVTCATSDPLSVPPTREAAGGKIPPRKE